MSVLITADALLARRAVIPTSRDLAAVRAHLDEDVARLLAHPLYVPEAKALLSRWGAHCRDDGAELAFDPYEPHRHACTRCARVWSTEQSHRWWVYWYQLWLAERVLVMALGAGGSAAAETRAVETLAALVERYAGYPDADNVLGPSRPFFSTYLESVWALHLAAAASVLEDLGRLPKDLGGDLRAKLFRPSAALIADYDEGRSNRQVWNAAALYALGRYLGDAAMAREAAHGPSGIVAAIGSNLLADGLWYEGENYHWFALRGLVWGVEMLRTAGEVDIWNDAGDPGARFRAAFRAPVLTALPDFTFPARRDSKFGVSLRQRRMAELWELALARLQGRAGSSSGDDADFYASLLAHVYDPSHVEGSDGWREISDVERAEPPRGVRRGSLGWKALAWAVPALPAANEDAWRPGTAHLEATGLAIFRRDEGRTYVSLDYGQSGGGHAHPDRLHVTAVLDGVPWLLDFGTGSYVAPSLAWYRSTLAHNAPLVDGHSQLPCDGACLAFDEQDGYGWVCAGLPEGSAFDAVTLQRTLVVTPEYVLDIVQMRCEGDRQLALPWHGLGAVRAEEHGLAFAREDGSALRILLSARQPFTVLQQRASGPPPAAPGQSAEEMAYPIVIATGEAVTLAACLDATGAVAEIECAEEDFLVRLADGRVHQHRASDDGWEIELDRGDPVRLGGLRELPEEDARAHVPPEAPIAPEVALPPLALDRADQFRRAEEPWPGKEAFSALADVRAEDDDLLIAVDVVCPEPNFRPAGADPEWENENPDIHSDGVQVYVETAGFFGWLVVPDAAAHGRLRVWAVPGTDAEREMVNGGSWEPTPEGYRVRFRITLPELPKDHVGFDVYVNRLAPGRTRRSGQLVWSGARGQRLYLAGDRAMPGALPRVRL